MKKILLLIFVDYILLCSAIQLSRNEVLAVESTPSAEVLELPTVHILPDNPLYFLKTIKEKAQLLFTRNTSNQAHLLLSFSQKRLAEALKVAEKGKPYISEKLFEAFGEDIEAAQQKIRKTKEGGERTYSLLVELQKTIAYQKSVLEKLQGEMEDLNSFLVKVDQDLGATESAEPLNRVKMSPVKKSSGPGIFDWLKGLFGKKEILSPLVR